MTDIHSCSYFCTRPACVLAQRDELRDKLEQQVKPVAMDKLIQVAWKMGFDAAKAEQEEQAEPVADDETGNPSY